MTNAIVGYVSLALVALVMALVARDVAVRWFADRSDARAKRTTEAETAAAKATADVAALTKLVRELETRVQAALAARLRR